MTEILTPEIVARWDAHLTEIAKGLDLSDADDRAIFRTRLADTTGTAKRDLLVALCGHYGWAITRNSSRASAARVLADAWVQAQR